METTLAADKRLEPAHGTTGDGIPFSGYEMHMGVTEGPDRARSFACLADGLSEGAIFTRRTGDRNLYSRAVCRRSAALGLADALAAGRTTIRYDALVDETLDRLAAHLAAHIDLDLLLKLSR